MIDAIIPYENCFTCRFINCKSRRELLDICDLNEVFGPAQLKLKVCQLWEVNEISKKILKKVEKRDIYKKAEFFVCCYNCADIDCMKGKYKDNGIEWVKKNNCSDWKGVRE